MSCTNVKIYDVCIKNQDIYLLKCYTSVSVSFSAKVFRFHIESWPEWDSNLRPRAYRAHTLTTELSGRTMRCA